MDININWFYSIEERSNRFAKNGKEWALRINFGEDSNDSWVAYSWEKEPTSKEISEILKIGDRFIEVFINQTRTNFIINDPQKAKD